MSSSGRYRLPLGTTPIHGGSCFTGATYLHISHAASSSRANCLAGPRDSTRAVTLEHKSMNRPEDFGNIVTAADTVALTPDHVALDPDELTSQSTLGMDGIKNVCTAYLSSTGSVISIE
ncbi:hypothetical protein H257_03119 [Aphanomyces astaci]|uniref:Uncharacterized protein n=1 Tax=Aphanomyces astaci TaxID=112090 RepID=W4H2G7_APHAT|nr:hypothetical protein H257_03119 [Aphanomyces astaci]ETV85363.1 hypothetical protein H257_03119 [Aphanomyces astaci]|eukprot:XP_009825381.1 hypothetical protein H257_03119 [Aphanomyces astaci]